LWRCPGALSPWRCVNRARRRAGPRSVPRRSGPVRPFGRRSESSFRLGSGAGMLENVEHGVRAPGRARKERRALPRPVERAWEWSLEHALLFPIVALFLGTIVSSLPRELVSDSWFAIFGGHE